MTNPWMSANPLMTLWFGAADQAAGSPEMRRAQLEATRQAVAFWTDIWMTPITGPRARRR